MPRARSTPETGGIPFRVQPMLATLIREPFHRPGWVYEEKYDGYRILAYKAGQNVQLLSRNAIDRTTGFAQIAAAIRSLQPARLILDGEAVAFGRKRVSRFQLLQQGGETLVYAVFDCLFFNGQDLRREPLFKRRTVMEQIVGTNKFILTSRRLADNGLKAYQEARRKGYEGVVAKDVSSPYVEGRSRFWLKVKVHQEDEFVIVGFTEPAGARQHFGALLLGAYESGKLHYVGKVGTGFTAESLADLSRQLAPLRRERSDLVNPPRNKGIHFVAPSLVAQIAYQELTSDGQLRQPVFLGLRDDKSPKEVQLPQAGR
ncbi:MAG TPA: non-homologous end-joining DNA ligase [Candidatus Dormibacteraeota bacterium]|nr:non-homologous end-joining DNA ligase [Candidatus Dormibacteraeota bacterium]